MKRNLVNYRHQFSAIGLIALAAFMGVSTHAQEGTIGILKVIPFDEATNVPQAVRDECQLGEKVSDFLAQYAKNVKASDSANPARFVKMAITEVHAPGGGAFSGPKWMEVTGSLMENGEVVASFRAKRFSSRGGFGTCSIIGRSAKAIAKDISKWLKDPVDGAELGDAR